MDCAPKSGIMPPVLEILPNYAKIMPEFPNYAPVFRNYAHKMTQILYIQALNNDTKL